MGVCSTKYKTAPYFADSCSKESQKSKEICFEILNKYLFGYFEYPCLEP